MCEKTSGIAETTVQINEKRHENRLVQFYHSLESVWNPDALVERFIYFFTEHKYVHFFLGV